MLDKADEGKKLRDLTKLELTVCSVWRTKITV